MTRTRKLYTDADFQDAMEQQRSVRVFEDDHLISTGGVIIRFDVSTIVIQSSVSELAYHERERCEYFEIR